VLVQKSVTTITNLAGRLSILDARQSCMDSQEATGKKMAVSLLKEAAREIACRDFGFATGQR